MAGHPPPQHDHCTPVWQEVDSDSEAHCCQAWGHGECSIQGHCIPFSCVAICQTLFILWCLPCRTCNKLVSNTGIYTSRCHNFNNIDVYCPYNI